MGIIGLLTTIAKRKKQRVPDVEDDQTTDKYLRSLRRQRRVQMEEKEKERLKKIISSYNKARTRRYLWGMGSLGEKERTLKRIKKKKVSTSFLGKSKL